MSFETEVPDHNDHLEKIKQENDLIVENHELPFYLIRPTPRNKKHACFLYLIMLMNHLNYLTEYTFFSRRRTEWLHKSYPTQRKTVCFQQILLQKSKRAVKCFFARLSWQYRHYFFFYKRRRI
jgi:hypothetical protein